LRFLALLEPRAESVSTAHNLPGTASSPQPTGALARPPSVEA
jgi:hypothetical protein